MELQNIKGNNIQAIVAQYEQTHTNIIEVMRKHGSSRKLHKCNSWNRWLHTGTESHSNTTVRLLHSHNLIIRKSAISVFTAHALFTAERLENKCNACHCLVPNFPPSPVSSPCLISPLDMLGTSDHIWGETYLHGDNSIIFFKVARDAHKHECVVQFCTGLICNFTCY